MMCKLPQKPSSTTRWFGDVEKDGGVLAVVVEGWRW
jgi:hypothetical protein